MNSNTVTIIGAGPAGLKTAIDLANKGWQTTVIEEHEEIGKPVNCSGLISENGVTSVGLDIRNCIVNQVKGARIFAPNNEMLQIEKDKRVAFVIDRAEFDKTLAKKAIEKGVIVRTKTKLIDVRKETLFVETGESSHGELLKSKIVVGADGPNSKVRQLMGIQTKQSDFVHSFQVRAKGSFDRDFVEMYFGDFAKGFFGWIIPESNSIARIGLACSVGQNPLNAFEKFVETKQLHFDVIDQASALIPIAKPLLNPATKEMMLVGDAAWQTKATSIDFEEPIVILDENGFVRNEKIGCLAAREFTDPQNEIIKSQNFEFTMPEKNIMALSPSSNGSNNGFKGIKTILKHNVDEQLFEIILEKGYRIKTTASHSVMVATKEGFVAKEADKLTENKDLMAISSSIPKGKKIEEICLVKAFVQKCPEIKSKLSISGAKILLYQNRGEVEEKKASQYWGNDCIPLEKFLEKGIIPENVKVSVRKGKLLFDDKIKITPELCRLLGYFAAEGSYKSNNLTLTFGIKDIELGFVQDAVACIRKSLNIEPENLLEKKNPQTGKVSSLSVTFGGTIAKMLFSKVFECGVGTAEKQVPWVIFNVEENLKKEFLKGYLRGDGMLRIRNPKDARHRSAELSVKTISRKMVSDLSLLSFQCGLFPSIEDAKAKEHKILGKKVQCKNCYRISFSNKQDLLWLLEIFPEKQAKLEMFLHNTTSRSTVNIPKELLEGEKTRFNKALIQEFGLSIYCNYKNLSAQRLQQVFANTSEKENEFVKTCIKEKIILLKVKEIRKVNSTDSNVFDIEIPSTQMFSGGIGPILLHNTGGGVITGCIAAKAAADTISEHLKNKRPLTDYHKRLYDLEKELLLHWRIRNYLNSLSEQKMNSLFSKLKKAKIEEFLAQHGDVDKPSRFVGKLAAKPSMWFLLPEFLKFIR